MAENPEDIVRRLQAQVDAERKEAIEVQWTDPGPYRLPRCTGEQGAMLVPPNTVELQLVTEKGQRVIIPIEASIVESIGDFLLSIARSHIQKS